MGYDVVVDIPEYVGDQDNDYEKDTVNGRFRITGLEEASVYQVKIAAENVFGISTPLNIFTFATKGADPVQQPMIVTSASTAICFSSFCEKLKSDSCVIFVMFSIILIWAGNIG